jgi:tetratricopeptide (TPR) repeat protein
MSNIGSAIQNSAKILTNVSSENEGNSNPGDIELNSASSTASNTSEILLENKEEIYLTAYEKNKTEFGEDHIITLSSMHDLGRVYCLQGKFDLAEALFSKCLEKRVSVLSEDHVDTLTTMNDLALLYASEEKYDAAENFHLKCYGLRKRKFGANHPDTIASMNYIADIYEKQGQLDKSVSYLEECLNTRRKSASNLSPNDHQLIDIPGMNANLKRLADVCKLQRKYSDAENYYVECYTLCKTVYGSDHNNTIYAQDDLAHYYSERGQSDRAEGLFQKCLEYRRKTFGENIYKFE